MSLIPSIAGDIFPAPVCELSIEEICMEVLLDLVEIWGA